MTNFLYSAAFTNDDTQTLAGSFSCFFKKQKGTIFFFSFSHALHGRKKVMYEHVASLFPFLHIRLEKSGWMDEWPGQGVPFDRILETTRSREVCIIYYVLQQEGNDKQRFLHRHTSNHNLFSHDHMKERIAE